ncbi:MAG: DUF4397 domain-containing protein [Ferruginibacter sp.]
MKKIKFIPLAITVIAGSLLYSCKKDNSLKAVTTDPASYANVKIYSATLNASRNYLFTGQMPLTGSPFAYGGVYPANDSYFTLPVGNTSFTVKDTLTTTTQPVISFGANIESGKYYTIFTYDTMRTPKAMVVADNITIPADTTSRVRFANFIYSNTGAAVNVDLWSKRLNANVFTNIPVNTVTDFISYSGKFTDTLYVRNTGTSTNLTALYSQFFDQKRSYTLIYRGSAGAGATKTLGGYTNY